MGQVKQHRPIQRGPVPYRSRPATALDVMLTPESIAEYLAFYQKQGYAEETLQSYQRKLEKLYDDLPDDKIIRLGFMDQWRDQLLAEGYSASSVNGFLSASNTFLKFIGHRGLQAAEKVRPEKAPQPELTRTEYLRLLQTAKLLGKEKTYLLVKLFATTPLNVQELDKVTVEAVTEGRFLTMPNGIKTLVRFPSCLREELLRFAQREGKVSGPLFVTREGKALNRTYICTIIRQLCQVAQVPEEKGNPRCLRKLYQSTLPKYIYPLTRVMSSVVNLAISLIPLLIVCVITGVEFQKSAVLAFFFLICLTIFSLGLGLLLSASMVFFRDTQFLWGVLSMMWMYATPIFYPETILPEEFRFVLQVNPIYHFLKNTRLCILSGISPEPVVYVQCLLIALGALLIGALVFRKAQDRFVLYL